jgi:hypothetical protein
MLEHCQTTRTLLDKLGKLLGGQLLFLTFLFFKASL